MNNCWAKVKALLYKTSHNLVNILHNKPGWLSGLVEWHGGEWYPWCRRKWQAMWLPHVSFLGSWRCQFLPNHISSFAFQVILKAPSSLLILSGETMFSNSLIKCKFFALNSNYTCTNERHTCTHTHTCKYTHVRACARAHAEPMSLIFSTTVWT